MERADAGVREGVRVRGDEEAGGRAARGLAASQEEEDEQHRGRADELRDAREQGEGEGEGENDGATDGVCDDGEEEDAASDPAIIQEEPVWIGESVGRWRTAWKQ